MEIDINFRETNIIFQHKNSPQKLKKEPFFLDKKRKFFSLLLPKRPGGRRESPAQTLVAEKIP